ncbi:MAG: pyridoxal 5'-phosphate synthase glutaminase subunit PdxT [Actinomycetota bacterium]
MPIGVLALQGDFERHIKALTGCGYESFEVRNRSELESADALVIPGGESTTMLKLIDRYDLRDTLVKLIGDGLPVFGTCAGAIVIATETSDGEQPLGVLDMDIERNAYGRQAESFEAVLEVADIKGGPIEAVFIRAPVINRVSDAARVLAWWADQPVLVVDGNIMVATFHPELSGDFRIHQYFVHSLVKAV